MKLATPLLNEVVTFDEEHVTSIVMENQVCFRKLLEDLSAQTDGGSGISTLSMNNVPVPFTKYAEIIQCFVPFDLNRKTLQTRIISELERLGNDEKNFLHTRQVLALTEKYIDELALDLPCDIISEKLTFSGLLKAAGITIADVGLNPVEKLVRYMEMVCEFERNKLFIMVNMRSWFTDENMEGFIREANARKMLLLLLECCDRPRLSAERRLTVDKDWCEI